MKLRRKPYSLRFAFLLLIISLIIGVVGFELTEGMGFIDSFYLAIITISTVGYGTPHEFSESGKIFASFYIITNIGILAYIVSVFTKYVMDGRLRDIVNRYMIHSSVKKLKDHVIVCGLGRNGARACKELSENNLKFVVIDTDPERFNNQAGSKSYDYYVTGDATRDETLKLAGIGKAKAIIAALTNDSDNVFVALTARELNKNINIITRASHPSSESKLLRAGANHVVLPNVIGGHYMASLVTKPTVVEFLEMINGVSGEVKLNLEEFHYNQLKGDYRNKTLAEMNVRAECGVTIIGFKKEKEGFIFNPSSSASISDDTELIVLGTETDLKKFREVFIS